MNLPQAPAPIGLLAELTHRCPLACPYCSNPVRLEPRESELTADEWIRVFGEAAALGVLQLHLSGGEPAARADLEAIVTGAARAGLYSNLITSGVGLPARRLEAMARAGLDHVQLSLQHVEAGAADWIAGRAGSHGRKLAAARMIRACGLPLTINAVLHRLNIDAAAALVELAIGLGAERIELAHAQYYGWAARNIGALLPDPTAVEAFLRDAAAIQARYGDAIRIEFVMPDLFAREPKPCMGGWGRRTLNVTPLGKVLPCHAAETIPGLTFWSVREHSLAAIWADSPSFQAFRGESWMREPCRSCPQRGIDFGGCRCQALALTGDACNADPVCARSPHRPAVDALLARSVEGSPSLIYRAMPLPLARA